MLIGDINVHWTWWVARSGGIVAWALCTASIVWGLALSTRLIRRRGAPAWLLDLHRFLGSLSLVFTVVHIVGLYLDKYSNYRLAQVLVPLQTMRKGLPSSAAVAWGVVGLYLIVAIQLTSWMMRKMPRKVWHAIHLSSFLLFVVATVHGFQAGHDRANTLVLWVAFTGTTLVAFLITFRTLSPRRAGRQSLSTTRA